MLPLMQKPSKRIANVTAQWLRRPAQNLNLRPALLHAVVLAESAYDPRAKSRAGAVGLMQLMPGTAERYGVSERGRWDPEQNLRAGAHYLRDLLKEFKLI